MKLNIGLAVILGLCQYQCSSQGKDEFESQRLLMVKNQLISRGVKDKSTLDAFLQVPRHKFVTSDYISEAYDDHPIPIGYGQTISQPYIVAFMTEVVEPQKGKKALEIGTGSGYQAAILAEIIDSVFTIEIIPQLANQSRKLLNGLGYNNVIVKQGDGYKGWPQHAPFDIIIVTAACDHIPEPLIDQLGENGKLVMPVGKENEVQELILLEKNNGKISKRNIAFVRFVPFTRENINQDLK